jgi:ankyrin repeat protein
MDADFSAFIRAVVDGDLALTARMLATNPELAKSRFAEGATRGNPHDFFIREIAHYVYRGDTALHLAAAAFQRAIAELLVKGGADTGAKNRMGAEPLHYAADTNHRDPVAQSETISYLISVGSNPNATDAHGVAPLHRAVRTRSAAAVRALLIGGADAHQKNRNGSTPRDLATRNTGKSGSGSPEARAQQKEIIAILSAPQPTSLR